MRGLRRSLAARRLVGARALLVHAIDEQAAEFYRNPTAVISDEF